jgi:hypothetical protein
MSRLILFLTGIVLVGIAGFALVWFGVGRELQPGAARVLLNLRDGKAQVVCDEAHPSLRARWSAADLTAYWDWWGSELGGFFEILARRGVSTSTQDGETRKGLTLELGFMKRKARMRFEFITLEEGPVLTHIRLYELDEGRGAEADRDELIERVRALMGRYDASDWVGLYAALSFDLQKTWPLGKLREALSTRRAATGPVKTLSLAGSEAGDEKAVTQTYEIEYEKARGTAKVTQQFDDDRWHITGFVLEPAR